MSVIVAIKSENVVYMGCDTQTTSGKDKVNKLQESTFKISKFRSGMLVGICGIVAAHQCVCNDEINDEEIFSGFVSRFSNDAANENLCLFVKIPIAHQ